ncbi:MAG: PAS domain S-box protein, partial [Verrucomicrobia bacterium]|nr:PAS domain S-box protein [Verrucomicrobiota bacterium]
MDSNAMNSKKTCQQDPKDQQGEFTDCKTREEFLEMIFAHVAEAILVADLDGRIIDCNPAACAVLGSSREKLLTRPPWDFLTSASREEIVELVRGLQIGAQIAVLCEYRRRTDEQGIMDLRLTRFGGSGGDLLVASCRDLTEHKQLEEPLRCLHEHRLIEEELRR